MKYIDTSIQVAVKGQFWSRLRVMSNKTVAEELKEYCWTILPMYIKVINLGKSRAYYFQQN